MGLSLSESKTQRIKAKATRFDILHRHYLTKKLHKYYTRKSQRKSKLYGSNAFETLDRFYGLIEPSKYVIS